MRSTVLDRHRQIARLQSRLESRFDLVTEPILVGPLRVQFTRVRDPEKVLDELCQQIDAQERLTGQRVVGDELGLPYWAELWDSAIGVGQWLVGQSIDWKTTQEQAGKTVRREPPRVLDLGCGMGLAGTVAAMLGADVVFADLERDCLLFSALNGLRYSSKVRARRVNWQKDHLGEQFGLIIGSDVLYDKTQWPYLERFFRAHLAADGAVILGEPGRQTGELFVPWICDHGWTFIHKQQIVPTRPAPIKLFELTL